MFFLSTKSICKDNYKLISIIKEGIELVNNYSYNSQYDDSIIVSRFDFSNFSYFIDTIESYYYFKIFYKDGNISKISKRTNNTALLSKTFDIIMLQNGTLKYFLLLYYNEDNESYSYMPHFVFNSEYINMNIMFTFPSCDISENVIFLEEYSNLYDGFSITTLNRDLIPQTRLNIIHNELLSSSEIIIHNNMIIENTGIITNYFCKKFHLKKIFNRLRLKDLGLLSEGLDFPTVFLCSLKYNNKILWFYYF